MATGNGTSLEELKSGLLAAVSSGFLESLREIISKKAKNDEERKELINSSKEHGGILYFAAKYGRTAVITWILSNEGGRAAGFDSVLALSYKKNTALHVAAEEGHLEACKAIVNGCRVEERAEMLNTVNEDGWTALHFAVKNDHVEIVQWLLSEKEGGGRALGFHNIFARTTDECTVLCYSVTLEMFLAVVDGCRVETGEREKLLNDINDAGWTILHFAAFRNRPTIISWLLSAERGGAAGFDRSLITAMAAIGSHSALHLAARSSIDSMEALLCHCTQEEKINLFLVVDNRGWTALHLAAKNDRPDCIAKLFQFSEYKMIANMKDNLGMTALHRAIIGGLDEKSKNEWAYYFKPHPDVIAALLGSSEAGWTSIDPNIGLGKE